MLVHSIPRRQIPSYLAFLPGRLFRRIRAWLLSPIYRRYQRRLEGLYLSHRGEPIIIYAGVSATVMVTYRHRKPGLSSVSEIAEQIRAGHLIRLEGPLPR